MSGCKFAPKIKTVVFVLRALFPGGKTSTFDFFRSSRRGFLNGLSGPYSKETKTDTLFVSLLHGSRHPNHFLSNCLSKLAQKTTSVGFVLRALFPSGKASTFDSFSHWQARRLNGLSGPRLKLEAPQPTFYHILYKISTNNQTLWVLRSGLSFQVQKQAPLILSALTGAVF